MPWATVQYTKAQVDHAGEILAKQHPSLAEFEQALTVLSNWRSAHSFPLNTFQVRLRDNARTAYEHALVAQRLKRVPSIVDKLRRYPHMKLSRMQDIGGCRAVVDTTTKAARLRDMYANSKSKHELKREYDYINNPKASGYRSIHLVYHYRGNRTPQYNGLSIEVQIRSRIQHAWATAVETMGTFLQQSLKSSQGPEDWLRFFALVSSAFALIEKTPIVPRTPTDRKELFSSISELGKALDVQNRLRVFRQALTITKHPKLQDAHYFLLVLKPNFSTLSLTGYTKAKLEKATEDYGNAERAIKDSPGSSVVLVAVDSLAALQRAYPNYFLDTEYFFKMLARATAD